MHRWLDEVLINFDLQVAFEVNRAVHLSVAFKHAKGGRQDQSFSPLQLAAKVRHEVLSAVVAAHALPVPRCIHHDQAGLFRDLKTRGVCPVR